MIVRLVSKNRVFGKNKFSQFLVELFSAGVLNFIKELFN